MLIFRPKMELFSPRMGPLCAHQPWNGALQPQNGAFVCCSAAPPTIPAPPLFAAPNSHFFTPKRSSPFPCLCVFPNEGFFCPPKKSFCAPEWHFRCPVLCSRAPFPPYGPNPKADFPFFALFWPFLPQTSELNRRAAPKTLTLGLKRPQNDLLDAIQPQRAFLTLSCPLSPKIALFWPIFRAGRG